MHQQTAVCDERYVDQQQAVLGVLTQEAGCRLRLQLRGEAGLHRWGFPNVGGAYHIVPMNRRILIIRDPESPIWDARPRLENADNRGSEHGPGKLSCTAPGGFPQFGGTQRDEGTQPARGRSIADKRGRGRKCALIMHPWI